MEITIPLIFPEELKYKIVSYLPIEILLKIAVNNDLQRKNVDLIVFDEMIKYYLKKYCDPFVYFILSIEIEIKAIYFGLIKDRENFVNLLKNKPLIIDVFKFRDLKEEINYGNEKYFINTQLAPYYNSTTTTNIEMEREGEHIQCEADSFNIWKLIWSESDIIYDLYFPYKKIYEEPIRYDHEYKIFSYHYIVSFDDVLFVLKTYDKFISLKLLSDLHKNKIDIKQFLKDSLTKNRRFVDDVYNSGNYKYSHYPNDKLIFVTRHKFTKLENRDEMMLNKNTLFYVYAMIN